MSVLIGSVVSLSLIAFCFYGWDKRQSKREGARRTPEKTLHLLALLGGWPGALAGQRFFRHKTKKLPFQWIFWICVVLHVAAVASCWWLGYL